MLEALVHTNKLGGTFILIEEKQLLMWCRGLLCSFRGIVFRTEDFTSFVDFERGKTSRW